MRLPSAPGQPAPDAGAAVAEATGACRSLSTVSAELAVSGSIGGRRVRGRLLTGLAAPASARLEAVAPLGQPLFILVARGDDATLLLPREDRVLENGRPDAVLAAVAGVPLDAAALRVTLTGCVVSPDWSRARQIGSDWRTMPDGPADLYLHREGGAGWRLVAAVHRAPDGASWRAEYRDFQQGLPRAVRLASLESKRFDLSLVLSQVELNVPLAPEVFTIRLPAGARPMTLEELSESGPLASPSHDR